MLHMVVMSHGPDTCAAANPESGQLARSAMEKMEETSKKLKITLKGAWVDAPAHVFYVLADAPNAHAVNNLMTELQFFHWNTIDIHPVVLLEEAMVLAKDA